MRRSATGRAAPTRPSFSPRAASAVLGCTGGAGGGRGRVPAAAGLVAGRGPPALRRRHRAAPAPASGADAAAAAASPAAGGLRQPSRCAGRRAPSRRGIGADGGSGALGAGRRGRRQRRGRQRRAAWRCCAPPTPPGSRWSTPAGRCWCSACCSPAKAVGLDGAAAAALKIGNAAATQLQFRGQGVDLAPVTRDNVARLELK